MAADVRGWSFRPLSQKRPRTVTDAQAACLDMLEWWAGGSHHLYGTARECGSGVRYTMSGGIATFDGDRLTALVFGAHIRRIRVEVAGASSQHLTIYLHRRKPDGATHERHPSLDDALARYRLVSEPKEDR